ncbi:emp24/gp25L/p24 family/GOLD domain-containing protein [Phthorimaea operculella]|nr:emp24/gp25L/p24 family/GOLD domain-containing protein [Phthorimaea operculella]
MSLVIDATHGELDISFQLADPVGRVIVADYKKPESAHRHTSTLDGDYRFCFDNTFSTFSEKTVFFDILITKEDERDRDYEDDDKEMELGNAAETYMMRVRDISESVNRVKDNVSAARRLQELHSATESRDRNLAEEMSRRLQELHSATESRDRNLAEEMCARQRVGSEEAPGAAFGHRVEGQESGRGNVCTGDDVVPLSDSSNDSCWVYADGATLNEVQLLDNRWRHC